MGHKPGKGFTGMHHSDETKRKVSQLAKQRFADPEYNRRFCEIIKKSYDNGRINPRKNKHHSEESKMKMRIAALKHSKELSLARTGSGNPMYGRKGPDSPRWRGGKSFEPYCPLFNNARKESVRNHFNRCCASCGKGEIQNGEKLSIHHIDGDKMQGCNGKKWILLALCRSCHSSIHNNIELDAILIANLGGVF